MPHAGGLLYIAWRCFPGIKVAERMAAWRGEWIPAVTRTARAAVAQPDVTLAWRVWCWGGAVSLFSAALLHRLAHLPHLHHFYSNFKVTLNHYPELLSMCMLLFAALAAVAIFLVCALACMHHPGHLWRTLIPPLFFCHPAKVRHSGCRSY